MAEGSVAAEVTLFAAASTTDVVEGLADTYARRTGEDVKLSVAASSTLAHQIAQGAPADVFLSADREWMAFLANADGVVAGTCRIVLGNRLVLVAPQASQMELQVADGFPLRAALGDGRLALADPDHVPAGRYARAALQSLGAWRDIRDRLAPMANVRTALFLVDRGEAAAGVVYRTDAAVAPNVRVVGVFPADSHPPIAYAVAIVAGRDTPAARGLYAFLIGDEAQAVFVKAGFAIRSDSC